MSLYTCGYPLGSLCTLYRLQISIFIYLIAPLKSNLILDSKILDWNSILLLQTYLASLSQTMCKVNLPIRLPDLAWFFMILASTTTLLTPYSSSLIGMESASRTYASIKCPPVLIGQGLWCSILFQLNHSMTRYLLYRSLISLNSLGFIRRMTGLTHKSFVISHSLPPQFAI